MLSGEFERSPHRFVEKQVVLVTIRNGHIAGADEGVRSVSDLRPAHQRQ